MPSNNKNGNEKDSMNGILKRYLPEAGKLAGSPPSEEFCHTIENVPKKTKPSGMRISV
ncbi:MAG: hypothetical protein NPIRA03_16020 [Nitrospirales bacterium]|nr:MAG: hypothetical protein NPIRA03_16020 [Nitrospirales bacterium]